MIQRSPQICQDSFTAKMLLSITSWLSVRMFFHFHPSDQSAHGTLKACVLHFNHQNNDAFLLPRTNSLHLVVQTVFLLCVMSWTRALEDYFVSLAGRIHRCTGTQPMTEHRGHAHFLLPGLHRLSSLDLPGLSPSCHILSR